MASPAIVLHFLELVRGVPAAVGINESVLSTVASTLSSPQLLRAAAQTTVVDILLKAGFAESTAAAIARASSAAAIAAECPTAVIIVLLAALSTTRYTGHHAANTQATAPDPSSKAASMAALAREVEGKVALAESLIQRFYPDEVTKVVSFFEFMSAPSTIVRSLVKNTVVVGSSTVISRVDNGSILIEDCDSATVMVTASVTRITLRRCRNCTFACVPSAIMVTIEDCYGCSFTVAAPLVTITNSAFCNVYVWAHAPVAITGTSKDVAIGPYNAVCDGLMEIETFKRWFARGDCRFDASLAGLSACRAVLPDEFFWRFLPLPQINREHIVMPLAFSLACQPPLLPNEASVIRPVVAQKAEIKVQAAFVKWLVDENKVLPLKNIFR